MKNDKIVEKYIHDTKESEYHFFGRIAMKYRYNYRVFNPLVKTRGKNLEYAPYELSANYKIVKYAVKQSGNALQYASDSLKKNYKIAKYAIRKTLYPLDPLNYVSNEILTNYKFAKYIARIDGEITLHQYASRKLKPDIKIVKYAVKENGLALEFVPDFKTNYSIVKYAIMQNGYALKFVPDNFRINFKLTKYTNEKKLYPCIVRSRFIIHKPINGFIKFNNNIMCLNNFTRLDI